MNITIPKISKTNYYIQKKQTLNNKPQNVSRNTDFSFGNISAQLQSVMLFMKKENDFFEEFLNREGRLTLEEYKDIAKHHPYTLIKAKRYCDKYSKINITPQLLANIVLKTDKYLKTNYKDSRIISIGTSPAPLCEQLSMLGHDVVFVPATGLRTLDINKHKPEEIPALKYLIDYVKTKNIDDGKQNIVLDFTCTGMSLKVAHDLIEKYTDVKPQNLKAMPMNDLLNKAFYNASMLEVLSSDLYLDSLFLCVSEEISNVPHYAILNPKKYRNKSFLINPENKSEKEVFEEIEKSSQPLARAFSLCTMHEILKKSKT